MTRARAGAAPVLAVVAALGACSNAPTVSHVGDDLRDRGPPSASADAKAPPAPVASAPPVASASVPANVTTRTTPFPPAALTPPVERTAKRGDGVWTALPVPGIEPSPLVTTVVHPHKIKPFVVVALVAIDVSRLSIGLVAGVEEPKNDAVAAENRTGLIPPADVARLVAAMNGGFKRRHGEQGMKVGSVIFVPPKDDSCTLVRTAPGGVRIGSWSRLAKDEATFAFYRQGPPCLVEDGAKNPDTESEWSAKKWGSSETGEREIRRSAFALSKNGETLYFAVGDWVNADSLADGLMAAHVDAAVEFDINWSFTRFVLYGRDAQGAPVASSPLLEKLKFSTTEYWKAPSFRDFFYLTKR